MTQKVHIAFLLLLVGCGPGPKTADKICPGHQKEVWNAGMSYYLEHGLKPYDLSFFVSFAIRPVMKSRYRTMLLRSASLAAMLVALSGCVVTHRTIETAKEKVHYKPHKVEDGKTTALEVESVEKAKPGYYALVPFAFVADVALTPYYVGWYLHGLATGNIH